MGRSFVVVFGTPALALGAPRESAKPRRVGETIGLGEFGADLRQDPNRCSNHKRDGAERDRWGCLRPPALRSCASPSLHPERDREATENNRGAEPKGQHTYKAEDAADKSNLRGAIARARVTPGKTSENSEEREREQDDQ